MSRKAKVTKIALLLFWFLTPQSVSLLLAKTAFAQSNAWTGVCVDSLSGNPDSKDVATIQGLECLIANVFSVIITVIGLAGFTMLIVASFRWLASGGNTKQVDTAKGTMTYAIVGLVVSLSAFMVLELIASFTGVSIIRTFSIPRSN